MFRKLQQFRSFVQSQILSVRPTFESEGIDTLLVANVALEYNFTSHDAGLHRLLADLYEKLDNGQFIKNVYQAYFYCL